MQWECPSFAGFVASKELYASWPVWLNATTKHKVAIAAVDYGGRQLPLKSNISHPTISNPNISDFKISDLNISNFKISNSN